jgi:hypothetical protein
MLCEQEQHLEDPAGMWKLMNFMSLRRLLLRLKKQQPVFWDGFAWRNSAVRGASSRGAPIFSE